MLYFLCLHPGSTNSER